MHLCCANRKNEANRIQANISSHVDLRNTPETTVNIYAVKRQFQFMHFELKFK